MTPAEKFESMLPHADRLAKRIAKRFHRLRMKDDFLQVSRIALWECSLRHTDDSGDLWAYSRIRIQGACIDWIRKTSWFSRHLCKKASMLSLHNPSVMGRSDDGSDGQYEILDRMFFNGNSAGLDSQAHDTDMNPTYDEDQDYTFCEVSNEQFRQHAHERLIEATRSLPEKQRKVIEAFLDDRPLKTVAEELGVSPGRVSQLLSTAIAALRVISV